MNIEKEISHVGLAITALDLLIKAATKSSGDVDITHIAISLGIEEEQANTMYLLWLEAQMEGAA